MNDAIKLISWLNGEPDIHGLSFILNGRIVDTDMPYSSWQGKLALLWMNETNEEIGRLVATITKSWDKTVKIWAGHQPDWYANMQWISLYPESDWAPTPDGIPGGIYRPDIPPGALCKKIKSLDRAKIIGSVKPFRT